MKEFPKDIANTNGLPAKREITKENEDDRQEDIAALDELLKGVGIDLDKSTLDQMLSVSPDLKNLTLEEAGMRIQLLRDIGCPDRRISGIVGSCSYLCKSISDISKLLSTLYSYGFTDLAGLFFANPLILDRDSFEIDEYIRSGTEHGKLKEDIVKELQDKPVLFQEL